MAASNLNQPFDDGAQRGELMLPFCIVRGQAFWPASPLSPFTGGAVDWRAVTPTGRLCARIVYRRGFLDRFKPLMPYGIGLVELDVGPRLQAHIADPDSPQAPSAGDPVRLQFEQLLDGAPILMARKCNGREI